MIKNKKILRVAIADFPPLIISKDNKAFEGFEIELWEAIAQECKFNFEYEKHDFKDIIPLLVAKKIDVGLAGITITEKREELIDYSHSTLNSGLLISLNRKSEISFGGIIKLIVRKGLGMLKTVGILFVAFVLIFGHLVWLIERRTGTFNTNYTEGILESFWFIFVSATTVGYGDYAPATSLGQSITGLAIISGFVIFGLLIAQITSFLTVERTKERVVTLKDLIGKKVGTVKGSTSVDVLRTIGAKIKEVPKINEAYQLLGNGKIDAVVFDAPVAMYYEANDNENRFITTGEILEQQKYGIALQQPDTILEEKINRALLTIRESGQYDLIYKKWFGDNLKLKA